MIDETLHEQFLLHEYEAIVHPIVHEHFVREAVITNLRTELDADIHKGTNFEFAQSFQEHCPVEGALPTDYMIRHIEIDSGFDVLAGIRFRGLDLDRPFVAILHRTREFESAEHLRFVMRELQSSFSVFQPKAVLFYESSQSSGHTPHAEDADKRILMGSIRTIASIPKAEGLSIVRACDLDFYERYQDEYVVVSKLTPDYLRTETAELQEDMERYVKDDLTFKVFVDGEFAGVFIVTATAGYGASGYYVIENLLFEKFRGRKLADSVQSAVARELSALGGKLMFGSIYPSNLPSYRAAIRSHRVDIGGNYMVPISG